MNRKSILTRSLATLLALQLSSATISQAQQYCQNPEVLQTDRFQTNGEGIVTDTITGLQWQRCIVGLEYNDNVGRCLGMPRRYTFSGASTHAERESDRTGIGWRVPSKDELESLVIRTCNQPALDTVAFPNTPISSFWSNTPSPNVEDFAWSVYFGSGESNYMLTNDRLYLRLVRGDLISLELLETAAIDLDDTDGIVEVNAIDN